jgi:hypothetical protein
MSNGTCFIIQPFNDLFNKRYQDIYDPAVRAADLEPYRVDQDLTVDNIVEKIQTGIRDARICLADITLDNANVFYELGAAHARGKDVVMVCDKSQRTGKLPFDIAHRSVLMYSPESASDFAKLQTDISEKLKAMIQHRGEIKQLSSQPLAEVDGLEPMELALLVIVAEQDDGASFNALTKEMDGAGYTKIAAKISLQRLIEEDYVLATQVDTYNEPYSIYRISKDGLVWLRKNKNKIKLRHDPVSNADSSASDEPPF